MISVLNSHEIVRRQILHFKKMNLPDDIEIIFMDDGSNPPLSFPDCGLKNFNIYPTNEKRPWTGCLARNKGAKVAHGTYLLMTDIDHILTRPLIDAVYSFEGDRMGFPRFFAILDEEGNFTQDLDTLFEFGLSRQRVYRKGGLDAGYHGNSFAIRKVLFDEMGGYSERVAVRPWHEGSDRHFNRSWRKYATIGNWKEEDGPPIYTFPVGRFCGDETDLNYNPFWLFHNLKREMVPQPLKE